MAQSPGQAGPLRTLSSQQQSLYHSSVAEPTLGSHEEALGPQKSPTVVASSLLGSISTPGPCSSRPCALQRDEAPADRFLSPGPVLHLAGK